MLNIAPSGQMVDKLSFREAMSRLIGAVTIITTDGPAGRGGFTASAVCSVTDDPPMLLACMNRKSRQHGVFQANGVLCVNALTAAQEAISKVFAGAGAATVYERFQTGQWTSLSTGAPVLEGALASFDARIVTVIEAGTHSIFLCEVVTVGTALENQTGLAYYGRNYHPIVGKKPHEELDSRPFLRPLNEFL
jgi:flavin reductase